jgi:hypothetical protein
VSERAREDPDPPCNAAKDPDLREYTQIPAFFLHLRPTNGSSQACDEPFDRLPLNFAQGRVEFTVVAQVNILSRVKAIV